MALRGSSMGGFQAILGRERATATWTRSWRSARRTEDLLLRGVRSGSSSGFEADREALGRGCRPSSVRAAAAALGTAHRRCS